MEVKKSVEHLLERGHLKVRTADLEGAYDFFDEVASGIAREEIPGVLMVTAYLKNGRWSRMRVIMDWFPFSDIEGKAHRKLIHHFLCKGTMEVARTDDVLDRLKEGLCHEKKSGTVVYVLYENTAIFDWLPWLL